jgi:predicted nucleotidyltransferase
MEVLEAVVESARSQDDIAAVWLYGSRARGDHHEGSDYDLAVVYTDWPEDAMERRLRPELQGQAWQDDLKLPQARSAWWIYRLHQFHWV